MLARRGRRAVPIITRPGGARRTSGLHAEVLPSATVPCTCREVEQEVEFQTSNLLLFSMAKSSLFVEYKDT
jgi:hypothetical protein